MILPPYRRGDLKDHQWKRLQSLLPPQKPDIGRPNRDHRRVINGILWILRTGAPWRDLPESYGSWQTVSGRFYRWRKKGIWRSHITEATTASRGRERKSIGISISLMTVSFALINMLLGQGGES